MKKKFKQHVRLARYVIYKETLLDFREHTWTFIGSFVGIALIGWLSSLYFSETDNLFLIGSFGATSVLLFGQLNSPLAQPRNLLGGHLISGIVGVMMVQLLPHDLWLSSALSVSLSIVLMQVTKTLHPPGGATALIANIGSEKIRSLGYWYVLNPVLTGVLVLLIVALIINNITPNRQYPYNAEWYKIWKRRYR
ncbi:HPP family protein [Arundinibacter roseus]|uniref:HPP family protein n=1 Tax=Arundinibacter roseus TaxID=2070510 RepID=A0A4V2XAF1_9BACT|nr:HPP family protein [Arundinibacter roseus]TDB67425.1 HPP family protein [Arundinibacter roseus]